MFKIMPKSPRVSGFAHNQRMKESNECVLEVGLHEMPCCSYLVSDYDLLNILNIQGVPEKRQVHILARVNKLCIAESSNSMGMLR